MASLQSILDSRELDELLGLVSQYERDEPADSETVRSILERWAPQRAVFNLLLHPSLIPAYLQISVSRRAITQRADPYVCLAGAVALQEVGGSLVGVDWASVRDELIALLHTGNDTVACRSSGTLHLLARPGDEQALADALPCDDSTAYRNILTALVVLNADGFVVRHLDWALENSQWDPASKEYLSQWRERGSRPDDLDLPWLLTGPLWGYIPNLPPGP